MKKEVKSVISVVLTLVIILAVSFFTTSCLLPNLKDWFGKRTYSQTNCLTSTITEDMDVYDIAKHYRDGNATVAILVTGYNKSTKKSYESLGSGVCVASNGYKTNLDNQYVASKGSYIVTNYHVIDFYDSNEFSNLTLEIMTDNENTYDCSLLWHNKDLDVALIYCDEVNLNYVTMKDRLIDSERRDRLDYEQIFTIGTPLELDYLNRLTVGNVASDNPMIFYTSEKIYPYTTANGTVSFTNYPSSYNSRTMYDVVSNVYEDVVDIALGISPGNSGGGCFDKNGYLIGLSTLGGDVDETNGNQMNGMVGIYPIVKVLDRIIDNNENDAAHDIFTFESLGIKGLDAIEASYASYIKERSGYGNYYLDKTIYSTSYSKAFNFDEAGFYIISNSSKFAIPNGNYITSAKLNNEALVEINDRNDLIYLLLKTKNGDKVEFNYTSGLITKTATINF